MTILFGWSDTLHAMSTCFSCYPHPSSSTESLNNYAHNNSSNPRNASGNHIGQSNSSQSLPEALRPLLMNDSTDDEYADSLSLHSNIGTSGGKKTKSTTRPSRSGAMALSETETDVVNTPAARRNVLTKARPKRREKKKKPRDHRADGWFTVFGYHLFGKQQPAIMLPLTDDEEEDEEEEEEEEEEAEEERRRRRVLRLSGNGSGATLDSDAAPLDDAAIAAVVSRARIARNEEGIAHVDPLSGTEMAVGVTGSDGDGDDPLTQRTDKQRKRRERKGQESLDRALGSGFSGISSLNSFNTDGEFEGFQGSGDGASLVALKSPPSEKAFSPKHETGDMDGESDLVDFDGSIYTAGPTNPSSHFRSSGSRTTTSSATTRSTNSTFARSGRRSHHRGHSNASSTSAAADEFHETMFNSSSAAQRETSLKDREDRKKSKSKSKSKSKKTRSKPSPLIASTNSTAASSHSPSLPSPPGNAALGPGLAVSLSVPPHSESPTKNTNAKSETVPRLGSEAPFLISPKEPVLAYGLDSLDNSNNHRFPSVGFGRRSNTRLNGAFLAHRGD